MEQAGGHDASMQARCKRCGDRLNAGDEAFACLHACTYCAPCTQALRFRCPNCGGMLLDRRRAAIVAATPTEAHAVCTYAPFVHVCETGVGLSKNRGPFGEIVVSCGLAGGLRSDVRSGTVLVPREVRRPDGRTLRCDAELAGKLESAARRLGFEPVLDPMLTSETLVNGSQRERWALQGFAGVDMETGLLEASRVAAIRVVLDTPQRELSSDWMNPLRALLRPRNWPQAFWLARIAPLYARRAAAIVAASGV